MEGKKKTQKKQRNLNYEKKVAIGGTFEQAMKFLADKANKNVAERNLQAASK